MSDDRSTSGETKRTTSTSRTWSSSSGCGRPRPPSGRTRTSATRSGLRDPELLKDLEELGFTPDTLKLLPLVPVLHVAWAEGSVSPEERKLILDLARRRDIAEGSAADRQLKEWLAHKPPQNVFTRGGRIIMAMIAAGSPEIRDLSPDDLVKYSESIAAASGGILGLGKVSAEERAALAQIQALLKAPKLMPDR